MRVLDRLEELYAIGGGPGANRPRPSAAEDEAHELAAAWMREAGLHVEVDTSGNRRGRSRRDERVWVGSHLDTVPRGAGSTVPSASSPAGGGGGRRSRIGRRVQGR